MTEAITALAPSVGIVALIVLWVFLMLVGASYFHRHVPEVSGPSRWHPGVMRVGMALAMGAVGVLVADRQGLPPGLHLWVGIAGALLGLLAEWLWRKADRFISRSSRGHER